MQQERVRLDSASGCSRWIQQIDSVLVHNLIRPSCLISVPESWYGARLRPHEVCTFEIIHLQVPTDEHDPVTVGEEVIGAFKLSLFVPTGAQVSLFIMSFGCVHSPLGPYDPGVQACAFHEVSTTPSVGQTGTC